MVRRALALGVVATVGCTAILGIDKDYTLGTVDGAAEAEPDSPPPDVFTQDVFTQDVVTQDVVADVVDAAAPQGCAKYALDAGVLFCDDFDEGKPLGSGWSNQSVSPGTLLALVNDASSSAPTSLCATGLDASPSNCSASLAYTTVTTAASFIAVEADVRLDVASGPNTNALQPIEVGLMASSTPQWRARLNVYTDHAELEEFEWQADGGFGFDFNLLSQHLTIGQWTHVRIEVALAPTRTVSVYFDGTPVILNHVSKYQWPGGKQPMMTAGIVEDRWGYVGPWQFHVDNVALFGK